MPRKGKKAVFHGTKKQDIGGEEPAPKKPCTAPGSSTTSFESSRPSVYRNKRISDVTEKEKQSEPEQVTVGQRTTGYRLLDLACLKQALESVHMCNKAGLTVCDEGIYNGLCSTLSLVCLGCGRKTTFETSDNIPGTAGKCYDVNRRAVYGCTEIGLGRESLADFAGIMGMPQPSKKKSWYSHTKSVNQAVDEVF